MSAPRTALVTGAADGIGLAIATRLAEAGLRVALADLNGEAAQARAAGLGPGHIAIGMDVASEAAVDGAIETTIAAFGRLDIAICNAGIAEPQLPTTEQTIEAFRHVLAVHLDGTFLTARAAARHMIARGEGGAIVTISSIAALGGLPRRNAYGAAKAGIAALTRSLACEWAAHGIRVNAIAPGYTRTALVARLIDEGRIDETALRRRTPMGRLANPAEIAEAAWFLCSPAASFITGALLPVDGGWSAYGAAGDASA